MQKKVGPRTCKYGHLVIDDNQYHDPSDGSIECKICRRLKAIRYYRRQKLQRANDAYFKKHGRTLCIVKEQVVTAVRDAHYDAARKLGAIAAAMGQSQIMNPYDHRAQALYHTAWQQMWLKVTKDLAAQAERENRPRPDVDLAYAVINIGHRKVLKSDVGVMDEDDFVDFIRPGVLEQFQGKNVLFGSGDDKHEAVYLGCAKLKDAGWTDTEIENLEEHMLADENVYAHGPDCCKWERGKGSMMIGCPNHYYLVMVLES